MGGFGRCSGITESGTRCKGVAIGSSGLCHAHDPDRAQARSRAARKGGKRGGRGRAGSGARQLSEIKGEIRDAIRDVRAERVKRGIGAVMFQGFNSLLKAVESERRLQEQEELSERLEAVEDRLKRARDAGDHLDGGCYGY